jgi:thiamine-phosphate pyrophosphorylase
MSQTAILRILDASLNRAAEGLRVVEEYARFVLDDPFLTSQTKTLRHDLATAATAISPTDRHAARDTQCDVGTTISTDNEDRRDNARDVCAANLKRTEQSLRTLEEYGKLINVSVGRDAESLRYRLYTLEKALDIGCTSRERLDGVSLCVLIDGCESIAAFERLVNSLVAAKVGMIQLRDKALDDLDLVARARVLVALTHHQPPAPPGVIPAVDNDVEKPPADPAPGKAGRRVPAGTAGSLDGPTLAIINDRPDIAAAVHADGVHLGQEDITVKDGRAIVGTQMLIGVSTHNINQARAAVLDGANYLGAGPTFPSTTKAFDQFAGLDYLREVASEIRLPMFAIGGITAQNLDPVLATGISRVAVGSAVTAANDPACAAQELLGMLRRANNESDAVTQATMPSLTSDL